MKFDDDLQVVDDKDDRGLEYKIENNPAVEEGSLRKSQQISPVPAHFTQTCIFVAKFTACTCVGERGITISGFLSSKKSAVVLSMASLKGIFWDHLSV